ncbi:MAG: sulfotransferase, partial [Phycisphaerae bacterium]|nr:sulfotransferase [Phycisphaerae bacterium]
YHLPDRQECDAPDAPLPAATGVGDVAARGPRRKRRNRRRNGPVRFKPAVRKPPVWVLGLHRSGSSVTAGILHRLGVHMGNRLIGYENRGTGGFEARGLAKICEQAYPFPATEPAIDPAVTKRQLRAWLDHRMREAAHRGTIAGGKYPHLCFLVDMLLELEPESRFIHIDRPLDESIRSLIDRSAKARGWLHATPEQCERLQRALHAAKRAALARVSPDRVLTIRYHDLLANPSSQVDRIIEFLTLQVRAEQRQAAIALVEPNRKVF